MQLGVRLPADVDPTAFRHLIGYLLTDEGPDGTWHESTVLALMMLANTYRVRRLEQLRICLCEGHAQELMARAPGIAGELLRPLPCSAMPGRHGRLGDQTLGRRRQLITMQQHLRIYHLFIPCLSRRQ